MVLIQVIFFMFLPISPSARAAPDSVREIVDDLQKKYETTSDITAHFFQDTFTAGASEPFRAEGMVYFKRPHLMRWEYNHPEQQLIVTSGEDVYVYEKDAEQVMILPRQQFLTTEISRAFFFGQGNLKGFFIVEKAEKKGRGKVVVNMRPREPVPQVRTIRLTVSTRTHLVQEMWLEDQLGGRTHIIFNDIKVNTGLSDKLFDFVIPKGIEIYRSDRTAD